jgi:16S rRNA (guanine(966)-N(2))-methyltransferase RsmD
MRITGGIARGQQLKVPKGNLVRPTTDRSREAVFSILSSVTMYWKRGLDLFAGTGALGIEALSRDIEWVDFVDQDHRCCDIIEQNLKKVGFAGKAHVYCCAVTKAFNFLAGKYDVVFLDPPYSSREINDLMFQLAKSNFVGTDTIVVMFHTSRTPLQQRYGGLYLIKNKKYGDTSISIYNKDTES